MELADHRVPTGITGGNAFRWNGGQALEAGLRAVQVQAYKVLHVAKGDNTGQSAAIDHEQAVLAPRPSAGLRPGFYSTPDS